MPPTGSPPVTQSPPLQVVMKIIKYSADNLSTGSLCGLDVDEELQVTHCFPVVDEADGRGTESHQISMLRALREVRCVTCLVGGV